VTSNTDLLKQGWPGRGFKIGWKSLATLLCLTRRHRSNTEQKSGSKSESREKSSWASWAKNISVEGSKTLTSEPAKARDSTRAKRDNDSKERDESDPYSRKQDCPRFSIEDEIVIQNINQEFICNNKPIIPMFNLI
jgi:hypothetical protein